jgi:homogentisate phytyltransferase/homogentisate geranylgeranyltransferase
MNLYITGLNQITDVEIDKINKPTLPIPAGRLSIRNATIIVSIACFLSVLMGAWPNHHHSSIFLNVALWGSGLLGTLYSLPPFRWKRFPVLAAMCVVAVRGTIINAAFFAHARTALYQLPWNVPGMWYSSAFFCVFGTVIAIIKDVPDIVGDRIANIRTFSVRVGAKRMLQIGTKLLEALLYGTGIALIMTATTSPTAMGTTTSATTPLLLQLRNPGRLGTGIAAMVAGFSVRKKASAVDPQSSSQVYQYYMYLWKLFYLAYAALPFSR